MPVAYWINTFTAINDDAKLARYIELSGPAMRAAGGQFLARGIQPTPLRAQRCCERP